MVYLQYAWLVGGFIVLFILIFKKIPTTTVLLVFSSGMKISISVSFFHQNWEDTEGRKKLTKINARVSVCNLYLQLEDQDSNKPFIFM